MCPVRAEKRKENGSAEIEKWHLANLLDFLRSSSLPAGRNLGPAVREESAHDASPDEKDEGNDESSVDDHGNAGEGVGHCLFFLVQFRNVKRHSNGNEHSQQRPQLQSELSPTDVGPQNDMEEEGYSRKRKRKERERTNQVRRGREEERGVK